jgi:signal peptidase I
VPERLQRLLIGRRPARTLIRVIFVVVLSALTFGLVLQPIRTYGPSMLPTYRDGGLHLVNRLAYVRREPQRGDVVAIRLAGPRVLFVKRIIGLPGERVRIEAGIVRVDEKPLEEPYVLHRADWVMRERKLGDREYFVAGDNRGMRIEQHELGTVSRDRIVGRMLW